MAWHRSPARALTQRAQMVVPSEWRAVETDDGGGVYVTAMDALNLPTGPLGDWHSTMWRAPEGAGASTRTPRTEALCRIGGELWAREELVDAREALRRIGHPMGTAPEPVWAASHPRATAEMVMSALRNTGRIANPDPQSVRRWLDAAQRRTCARMLAKAKGALVTNAQRRALDEWIQAVSTEHGLIRVED